MMDPPRTNSISMTIVFNKLHGGEDAVLKCNRDANRRTSLCSLLQAFAGSGYLESEKSCRCPGAGRSSIGAVTNCRYLRETEGSNHGNWRRLFSPALRSCASGGVKLHLHSVVNPQEELAWILHSPPHIRNLKRSLRGPIAAGESYFDRKSNFALSAMHRKHAVNLERGGTRSGEYAIGAIRTEHDLRVAPALNHIFVHFMIAGATRRSCSVLI